MTSAAIVWDMAEPNTDAWLVARLGVISASKAYLTRERSDGLTIQQRTYVNSVLFGLPDPLGIAGYKKAPTSELVQRALAGEKLPMMWSDSAMTYARDLARERLGGGRPQGGTSGFAARVGHEQEPMAVAEYEAMTGEMTQAVGFAHTADRCFGATPDRIVIGQPGALEVKTMVSTGTLWDVFVLGNTLPYRDQCLMQMWLLNLAWVDLCLWVPDMHILRVRRIERNADELQRLEDDLMAFNVLVEQQREFMALAIGLPGDTGRMPVVDGVDDAPEPAGLVSVTTQAPVQQVLEPEF